MSERLVELCTKLQLPVTANSWSTVADQAAKNNIPYSTFLERLLEAELADKHLRSSQTLLKLSGFPFRKTLDEFQFEAQPSIDERRIRELLNLSFLESNENVLFLGPPGLGKTHLAISRGFKTYFISANDLVTQLRKADEDNRLERKLRALMKPRVLIVDKMGYLRLDTSSAHYLFQVISRRYERGSIILTSNKTFGEWGEILGDSVIATAILDRLLHHSRIF